MYYESLLYYSTYFSHFSPPPSIISNPDLINASTSSIKADFNLHPQMLKSQSRNDIERIRKITPILPANKMRSQSDFILPEPKPHINGGAEYVQMNKLSFSLPYREDSNSFFSPNLQLSATLESISTKKENLSNNINPILLINKYKRTFNKEEKAFHKIKPFKTLSISEPRLINLIAYHYSMIGRDGINYAIDYMAKSLFEIKPCILSSETIENAYQLLQLIVKNIKYPFRELKNLQ